MRAVDTNVIVRYLTNDDAEQSPQARRAIAEGGLFLTLTVMLETAWVLGGRQYRFPQPLVVEALRKLIRLYGVHVEDSQRAHTALDWAAAGMDLADAVHLAGARDCTAFVSFDQALAKTATRLSALPVVEP